MSENKHKEFNGRVPTSGILKKSNRSSEGEIPINVTPSPEIFSEQRTPNIREIGLQGDILILKNILAPFKDLAEKYLTKEGKDTPVLWDEERILLTVGDVEKLFEAYQRVDSLGKSIEWLEARVKSGTDPKFRPGSLE